MDTFLDSAVILLPLAYLAAAIAYGVFFFSRQIFAERLATPILRGALSVHLVYLTVLTVRWEQFPATTVSQALSVVAFAVGVVYALVEWHGRNRSTGFWMVSMVFLLELLSALLRRPLPPSRDIFHSPIFATHVSLALLGYAAFVVAAAYGFLFLELYRELKAGRFSTFYNKLPPLEVLERMMVGALLVGFAALTGAVGAGIFWASRQLEGTWLQDPKVLATLVIWLGYGLALLMRRLRRWQGRQTAFAALVGLGAILFSLVAVNFLFTGFHDFVS
jgi:ABC-type uncharacterized transport system permease subunit